MDYVVRKAVVGDIKGIHALLLEAAGSGQLLSRPLSNLYGSTRDFIVLCEAQSGALVGCCALALIWEDLAEIRSLFVQPSLRGRGWGKVFVERCMEDARELGIRRLFTLTYQTVFFGKLGFAVVGKESLPHKIWVDCIHCPKFPDCDEIAMEREI